MKRLFIVVLFALMHTSFSAQEAHHKNEIKIGDVLKIGPPKALKYKHIYFPRPNFIIKKGGIANYKSVEGIRVVVTSLKERKDGTLEVKIKKATGGMFFNSHPTVSADLKKALE